MMNLDEVLRGIGAQMSRAVPNWDALAPPAPAAAPQDSMGPFANYLSGQVQPFPEMASPGGAFPESQGFGGGFPEKTAGFGSFPEKSPQDAAMGHVNAAKNSSTPSYTAGTAAQNDNEVEQYIRSAFGSRGHDPDTAVAVWSHEGRGGNVGDAGSSGGPFQLHLGGVAGGGNSVGGLGDTFKQQTGLDPRDPNNWKAVVDWTADNLGNTGWTPYHGAAAAGIGPRQGVGVNYSSGSPAQAAPGAAAATSLTNLLVQGGHKLGESYDWGGAGTPGRGFDCSGLVSWLGTQLGVPGIGSRETTFSLFPKTTQISEAQAQPGDLVFYNMDSSRADTQHVAIYLGGGQILQSGGTQHAVNIGSAHQAVGSAPIFARYAPFTQAVSGLAPQGNGG